MNFNPQHLAAALLVVALVQVLAFAYSSDANKGLEAEEKTRLGSKPPSCHSKCNECHPCSAVQVPTLPSHDRLQPAGAGPSSLMELYHLPGRPGDTNRYSNYKPLGWKCRCNNHLYNP